MKDLAQQARTNGLASVHGNDGSSPVGTSKEIVAASDSDNRKTKLAQRCD
jgi:hypothetical protein